MNARDDVPGYGYQLKKGATALTESWAALEEVSNNHLMLGHLMRWFYAGLLGIDQAEGSVGYAALVLKPQVVEGIEWARASTAARAADRLGVAEGARAARARVEVPVNATAEFHVPAGAGSRIRESGRPLGDGPTSPSSSGRGARPWWPSAPAATASKWRETMSLSAALLPELDQEMAG